MKQVIYFSTNWCPSCQTTEPVIEQLKKTGIQIAKINTDYDVSMSNQYNIKNIPTIVILENGKEVNRHVGSIDFDNLKRLITG